MRNRFLPEVEDRLRVADWYPGRRIADAELERMDEKKPLFLYAQRAIEEFAGIYVESYNYKRSFCINPLALMEDDDLSLLERVMKRRIYPLGFIDYSVEAWGVTGNEAMFIDECGCVYAFRSCDLLIGLSIDEALNNLGTEKGFRLWDFANDAPFTGSP